MTRPSSADQAALHTRRTERVYAALAGVYDGFFDWALGPGRREGVRRLAPDPGDRVLEVGVGTGLSLPLYPDHCRITGIDISEAMLEHARTRLDALGLGSVELRRMDARSLDFPDGRFDRVFAPYVMSVVPDPQAVMAGMCRVLRPGGRMVVINRFASRLPPVAAAERLLTPLTQWIGFRMDLRLETVTATPGLSVTAVRRINMLGLWRLVELQRLV